MATKEERQRIRADLERYRQESQAFGISEEGECIAARTFREIVNESDMAQRLVAPHYGEHMEMAEQVLLAVKGVDGELPHYKLDQALSASISTACQKISRLLQPVADGDWAMKAREENKARLEAGHPEELEFDIERGNVSKFIVDEIDNGIWVPHFQMQIEAFREVHQMKAELIILADRCDAYIKQNGGKPKRTHALLNDWGPPDFSKGQWSGPVFQVKDLAKVCKCEAEFKKVLPLFQPETLWRSGRERIRVRYDLLSIKWQEELRAIEQAAT